MSGPILAELGRLKRIREAAARNHDPLEGQQTLTPLSELPYDPAIGAEQLAHAKQRIRDQRRELANLEGTIVVLKDTMARRQDILDYVRQIVLHDAQTLSFMPDERRADYQKVFLSVLDGDQLHGMSANLERQLLGEQLVALNEKVRSLDRRDATKAKTIREKDQRVAALVAERDELALQLSKMKSHHGNLYQAIQEARQDLSGTRDTLSQSKREADMLRKTLDSTLNDLKEKERQLSAAQSFAKSLEAQMTAAATQSDAEKLQAAESLKVVTACATDLAKQADQCAAEPSVTSASWLSHVQHSLDTVERMKTAMKTATLSSAMEALKVTARALEVQLGNLKSVHTLYTSLSEQQVRAASDVSLQMASLQSTVDAHSKRLASSRAPAAAAVMVVTASESGGGGGGIREFSLVPIVAACPLNDDGAQRLVASLAALFDTALRAWEAETQQKDRTIADLHSKLDTAIAQQRSSHNRSPMPTSPTTTNNVDDAQTAIITSSLQSFRSAQDSQTSKLFQSTRRGWEEQCDEFLASQKAAIAELKALDPRPTVVPSSVAWMLLDMLLADVALLTSGKRELSKTTSRMQEMQNRIEAAAAMSLAAETSAKANRSPAAPPLLARDACIPRLVAVLAPVLNELQSCQKAALDTIDLSNMQEARNRSRDLAARAVQICETCSVVDDEDRAVVRVIDASLRCMQQETEEADGYVALLELIDDAAVTQVLKNGYVSPTERDRLRRKVGIRALSTQQKRSASGKTDLLAVVEKPPAKKSPKQAPLAPPPSSAGAHTQTEPMKPAPSKVPSIDEAIAVLTKAGQWPPPASEPKQPPAKPRLKEEVSVQASSSFSIRSTQTPRQDAVQRQDHGTMTDAYLLQQFLGIQNHHGDGGGVQRSAAPRRSSASIIQVFGDNGVLSDIGLGSRSEVQSLLPRTTSSIPSRRQSASTDLQVLAAKSSVAFELSKKHSVASLVQRREQQQHAATSILREMDDDDGGDANDEKQKGRDHSCDSDNDDNESVVLAADGSTEFASRSTSAKQHPAATTGASRTVQRVKSQILQLTSAIAQVEEKNGPSAPSLPVTHADFYSLLGHSPAPGSAAHAARPMSSMAAPSNSFGSRGEDPGDEPVLLQRRPSSAARLAPGRGSLRERAKEVAERHEKAVKEAPEALTRPRSAVALKREQILRVVEGSSGGLTPWHTSDPMLSGGALRTSSSLGGTLDPEATR